MPKPIRKQRESDKRVKRELKNRKREIRKREKAREENGQAKAGEVRQSLT